MLLQQLYIIVCISKTQTSRKLTGFITSIVLWLYFIIYNSYHKNKYIQKHLLVNQNLMCQRQRSEDACRHVLLSPVHKINLIFLYGRSSSTAFMDQRSHKRKYLIIRKVDTYWRVLESWAASALRLSPLPLT